MNKSQIVLITVVWSLLKKISFISSIALFNVYSIVSQLDKCLKFKSTQGDENDCTLYKITSRKALNFRDLSSCGTIYIFMLASLVGGLVPLTTHLHTDFHVNVRLNPLRSHFGQTWKYNKKFTTNVFYIHSDTNKLIPLLRCLLYGLLDVCFWIMLNTSLFDQESSLNNNVW